MGQAVQDEMPDQRVVPVGAGAASEGLYGAEYGASGQTVGDKGYEAHQHHAAQRGGRCGEVLAQTPIKEELL